MRINPILVSALLAATQTLSSPARAALSLEDAMEAQSTDLVLPAAVPGVLAARSCSSCPLRNLQLSASSRFFIGSQAISLSELRRQFTSGRLPVLVALKADSNIVTRIVITNGAHTQ